MTLPTDYLAAAEMRARRFQGTWDQGTSGSLAADVIRLLKERKELMETMDELNRTIREAVATRMAGTSADDPKMVGYVPPEAAGCGGCDGNPFAAKVNAANRRLAEEAVLARTDVAADLPADFLRANPTISFRPAAPAPELKIEPMRVGGTMTPEQLEAAWAGIKARRAEMLERIAGEGETVAVHTRPMLIGLTGQAGAGKNLVASMVPGAMTIGFADPLYAALAVLLEIPEPVLRHRSVKDRVIPWLGTTPRKMLQTLGHEWGRELVAEGFWITLCARRLDRLAGHGIRAVCIADVRYENEAALIRERGGVIWHVARDVGPRDDHASEAGVTIRDGDSLIENTGTPEDTRQIVLRLIGHT